MDSGNIFELEATGGVKSLDVWFEGQGRVESYSEVADFQPRKKLTYSASLSKSPVIWRKAINPPKSMCEDAECILREVQNKRKVLEDNLEAVARANDWARRYTLISTLATDSDVTEKIRLQKLVDSILLKSLLKFRMKWRRRLQGKRRQMRAVKILL
ncbi:unnamed protein product [Ranitomeya imitator]|uniref:Uncharacterized protein n=1 Tax=Ranitomeya imitator TaxID=111125 RepID=A0ABN9L5R4_9NEOB|nr:unnamed protein product [Ranitomeya imitator]